MAAAPSLGSARAMVLETPRHLAERVIELPGVDDDSGVLRVEACGLCGTDHEQYTGLLWGGFPFVPGHESVGVIERIGASAAERWGVGAGDRVAVAVYLSCRECDACRAEEYHRCSRHGLRDMYGFRSVDDPPGLWGGYADYQSLAPDSLLFPVPDELEPVEATLFNPLGAGIRWAATLPGTGPGDVVAVLGPGIRGLCACAAAKEAGAELVMVTGFGARDAARLALAVEFGADLVVDVSVDDPVAALRAAGAHGADIVVDVTAKAPSAFRQAIDLARPGGTVVVAGVRGEVVDGVNADLVVLKELRIMGALGVDAAAYRAAIDMLCARRFPFDRLPRRLAGFDDIADLVETMAGEHGEPPVHGVFVPGAVT